MKKSCSFYSLLNIVCVVGWVHENIEYRVRLEPGDDGSSGSDSDSQLGLSSDSESHFDGRRKRRYLDMEKTLVLLPWNYSPSETA